MVDGIFQIRKDFCFVCMYVDFFPKDAALEIMKTVWFLTECQISSYPATANGSHH